MAEETDLQEETEPTETQEEKSEEGRVLSEEDINKLIEGARKQEKDKLYGTIDALKEQVAKLAEERKTEKNEKERIEREAQAQAEVERLSKMSADEKVTEQLKKLEERLASEAGERVKLQEALEEERKQTELERYKAELLRDEIEIIPELVNGSTKEEIERSVAVAKEKYQKYFDAAVTKSKGAPGRTVAGVPGPADPDPDPIDEKDLEGLRGLVRPDMTTGSMKTREEISANRKKGVSPEYLKQKDELLTKIGDLYKRVNS